MRDQVQAFIRAHRLLEDRASVLVGVSGGLDSTVLLHVLLRLGYGVSAAHVNYGLRGPESDADEAFVRAFCQEHGVPLHVLREDSQALTSAPSMQAQARRVRYEYFAAVARREHLSTVAAAHHRDDQVETLLLNLIRGAGPEGLAGMAPSRALQSDASLVLIRPLLGMWRREIAAYAEREGLMWREDASNEALTYRRNVVRQRVLPTMEEVLGDDVRAPMARSVDLMRAYVDDVLGPHIEERFRAAVDEHAEGGLLRADVLQREPPVMQQRLVLEALQRWLPGVDASMAVAEEVASLLAGDVGRRVAFGEGTVWRTRDGLLFLSASAQRQRFAAALLQPGTRLALPRGTLALDVLDVPPANVTAGGADVAFVDADELTFPLTVRMWRTGDRIQPLGMTGTKRVSDLLTDEKIPPHDRKHVLVVTSADTIIWVVGLRLSEVVKVHPDTQRVARLVYRPSAGENR